jgi:hypothetical protein
MTEETGKPAEAPGNGLSARFFAVGANPYCVWDWDLDQRNLQYLDSFDPDYFEYAARVNLANLEAADPRERRRAATSIRTAYHHGLESFFALLLATLQAPHCVVGWMQAYSPAELRKLVRSVDPGLWGSGERRKEMSSYRERILPYVWVKPRSYLWEGISRTIHKPIADKEQAERTKGLFADLWRRFAKDLVDDAFVSEYNSIKHGLRTGFGGFSMAIGLQEAPDVPAPTEKMHSLGGSEHGSSFFTPRTFVKQLGEKDKRARLSRDDFHFRTRRQALNWDPKDLCTALAVISASLHNVRTFLLWMNGVDPTLLQFRIPAEEALYGPLGRPSGIEFSGMDAVVLKSNIRLFERNELRAKIEEGLRLMRERQGDAPPNTF